MTTHDIILKNLELLCSWPVMVAILILVFRKHVTSTLVKLAARVTSAEVGGQKFQFESNVAAESDMVNTLEEIQKTNPEVLQKAGLKETSYVDFMKSTKKKIGKIQQFLKREGHYNARVDGSYGPKTREAVEKFQEMHNLVIDGIIGQETLRKMDEIEAERR